MAEEVKDVKKPAAKKAPVKKVAPKTVAPATDAPVEAKEVKKPAAKKATKPTVIHSRLQEKYLNEVKKTLLEKYGYKSVMEIPFVHKVVINIGAGDAATNSKVIEDCVKELGQITGQRPVTTLAKNSIAGFKLREGQPIGCKVTLRGTRMYEFLDKLINIALPRVRDFRGVPNNSFDGRGNYTLGVKEQLIFPEIDFDKIHKIRGMDITVVTSAKTDAEAYSLLALLGMPFHK